MRLLLDSNSLLGDTADDGVYTTESGEVVYNVVSPRSLLNHKTTIYRAVSGHLSMRGAEPHYSKEGNEIADDDASTEQQRFVKLAEIEYHDLRPTIFRYGGREFSEHDIFDGGGVLGVLNYMGRDRIFTGPDGRQYAWSLGKFMGNEVKLFTHDTEKTLVAQFHRRHFGIFHDKAPPILEIHPPGEHMVDLIFVTFMFVERLRVERERRKRSGND